MNQLNSLSALWDEGGVVPGDTVMIHSNCKRLVRWLLRRGVSNPVEILYWSLIDAVGPEGTIVFPTFNFDFSEGKRYSHLKSKSQMGALSEYARELASPRRSGHPVYSFCAVGKNAEVFNRANNFSGYGIDSPFGIIRRVGGKIGVLDLEDQNSMTFYHHVEESCGVEYRYGKVFRGLYEDRFGVESIVEASIYVRDIKNGVLTDVNAMGELLWQEGIYKGQKPGVGGGFRVAKADDIYNKTKEIIDEGKADKYLYSINQSMR